MIYVQNITKPPDLADVIGKGSPFINTLLDALVNLPLFILPVVFAFAGFMYLTSGGNDEKIARSKSLMLWALLGLVVYLLALPIVKLILDMFGIKNVDPTKLTL